MHRKMDCFASLAMTMRITSAYAIALPSQSSKRVGMIRAPSSGTNVRNASGAPKYGASGATRRQGHKFLSARRGRATFDCWYGSMKPEGRRRRTMAGG